MALGLVVLGHREYEADDLIGSASHAARAQGFRTVLVSADKDLSQLLGEFDEQWDYGRGQRWGSAGVKARHGVHAHQIADYLALCGDAAITVMARLAARGFDVRLTDSRVPVAAIVAGVALRRYRQPLTA